ncbi:polyhydroxyalkanoate synthesis repressor PhaR [Rhodobium gokarnense]|uniref:Polyhydroxyalkanoate synthesis repressor PhaR n=1 Tax=Rhodobium gokarnense TaxID=364296 RepID=A0ABT3HHK8_9HYPH|nr:polyhydroxyalkanoate synthesis repressor PhaR [Rhodobium gokarnense]MCW2309888.1 polyhydroxyalkanoate synthesis repressor PhaR [Rhodobium gokarnense]
MAKTEKPTVIKKYANRRLYNTGTSTYVTLEDLAEMVKNEDDFVVFDAKSGDEITRSVLTQIIFEQENKGQNLLPIAFLRQLIRFYGDSMQTLVPSYLEFSMSSFAKEQEKLRQQMTASIGQTAFEALEDQVRRNTDMFEKAMRMFLPFGAGGVGTGTGGTGTGGPGTGGPGAGTTGAGSTGTGAGGDARPEEPSDISDLKKQLSQMQKQLDALSGKDED